VQRYTLLKAKNDQNSTAAGEFISLWTKVKYLYLSLKRARRVLSNDIKILVGNSNF
jgi:transposase